MKKKNKLFKKEGKKVSKKQSWNQKIAVAVIGIIALSAIGIVFGLNLLSKENPTIEQETTCLDYKFELPEPANKNEDRTYCYEYIEDSKPIETSMIKVIEERDGKYIVEKCVGGFVFKYLPTMPDDMWRVFCDISMNKRKFEFYEEVGIDLSQYYKQPEFYPKVPCKVSLWKENWHDFYVGFEEHSDIQIPYRGYGYGFYPQYVEIHSKPGTVRVQSIMLASPNSWVYQAIHLTASIPDKGSFKDEKIETTSKDLKIDIKPNDLVLEPTQPYFYPDWAKMIDIYITAEKPGTYLIYISPRDMPAECFHHYDLEFYNNAAFTASGVGITGISELKILLIVE